MAATTGTAETQRRPPAAISTITVAMAPGPASSGMASGTMATSSFAAPSWPPRCEVRVSDGRARSMSSAVMSSRMPPATRKAPRRHAEHLEDEAAEEGEEQQQPARHQAGAQRAMPRIFSGESPAVIARKSGTTPIGSTTKKTADSETRNERQAASTRPARP